jgi:hypothetical protein
MKTISPKIFTVETLNGAIFDVFALAFVYFVPAMTHLFNLPIYFIEPMRLMLILSMVHSGKFNAYILAITLPLFSYMISAHPILPKMFLISAELSLNTWLFFYLKERIGNMFFTATLSILISKLVYYLLKILMISTAVVDMEIFSTPILYQFLTMLLFSAYISRYYKRN